MIGVIRFNYLWIVMGPLEGKHFFERTANVESGSDSIYTDTGFQLIEVLFVTDFYTNKVPLIVSSYPDQTEFCVHKTCVLQTM